jgi:hypothetical protein
VIGGSAGRTTVGRVPRLWLRPAFEEAGFMGGGLDGVDGAFRTGRTSFFFMTEEGGDQNGRRLPPHEIKDLKLM